MWKNGTYVWNNKNEKEHQLYKVTLVIRKRVASDIKGPVKLLDIMFT